MAWLQWNGSLYATQVGKHETGSTDRNGSRARRRVVHTLLGDLSAWVSPSRRERHSFGARCHLLELRIRSVLLCADLGCSSDRALFSYVPAPAYRRCLL